MNTNSSISSRGTCALLAGLLLMVSAPALAQSEGVRSGRFRVHPEARVEGRFDNNLYRQDSTEGLTAAGFLRLMPSLRITNPYPGSVSIDGSLGLELRQYLDSAINDQQDAVGFNLAAGATLGQDKTFSLAISEDLRRQLEPGQGASQQAADADADLDVGDCVAPCSLAFWRNTTKVQGTFAPGGGRLVVAPSYKLLLTRFEEFDGNDKDTHQVRLGASYRFFPRTSLVFDGSYSVIDYAAPNPAVSKVAPVRVSAGLRGLITTKLATTLTGGYGTTNADSGDGYSSFIAQADLVYAVTKGMRARVNYARDFEDSSFSNFVQTDRVGLKLESKLGGNFNANADFTVSFRGYSQGFLTGVNDGSAAAAAGDIQVAESELAARTDTLYIANFAGSYHASDWLVVTGGYRLEQNDSSFGVRVAGIDNFAAFARHQIFLGAGLLL